MVCARGSQLVSHKGRPRVYSSELLPYLFHWGLHVTFYSPRHIPPFATVTTSFGSSRRGSWTWGHASLKDFLGPSRPGDGGRERLSLSLLYVCEVDSWRVNVVWLSFPLPGCTLLWLGAAASWALNSATRIQNCPLCPRSALANGKASSHAWLFKILIN